METKKITILGYALGLAALFGTAWVISKAWKIGQK